MRFDDQLLARARAYVSGRPAADKTATLQPVQTPAQPGAAEPLGVRPSAVDIALALARRFEGLFLAPYLCPAGVPTIGYGATRYLDGRAVRLTDPPISREAAERLLLRQVETIYLPAVLRLCPALALQCTAGQLAALIDFTFNLGPGALSASTLRRCVNAGQWERVPAELRKWVMGGGRVLRGLVLRREAEVNTLTGTAPS